MGAVVDSRPSQQLDGGRPSVGERLLALLSRTTSGGRFIPEIDGLRFFAIFLVILFHIDLVLYQTAHVTPATRTLFSKLINLGNVGVPLFFGVSGFILSLPFANHYLLGKSKPRLSSYYWRRVTRLEPPYIVCMLIYFVFKVHSEGFYFDTIKHLLASLAYLHNAIYHTGSSINFVAWSLEIEVQFYLLSPFLASVFLISNVRLRRLVIVGSAVLFALAQRHLGWTHFELGGTLLNQLQYFLVGFLLADLYIMDWKERPNRNYGWDVLVVACLAAGVLVMYYRYWVNLLVPILTFIGYVGAFRGVIANRITRNSWIAVTGGMCYSIYLYHVIILGLTYHHFSKYFTIAGNYDVNMLVQSMVLVPIIIVISAIFFLWLEKPFMQKDWPGRWKSALEKAFLRRK